MELLDHMVVIVFFNTLSAYLAVWVVVAAGGVFAVSVETLPVLRRLWLRRAGF